jgi:threonine aldolase
VIEIENTHNIAGGSVYPPGVFDRIADGAHEIGLRVHLDGARIFNAATYLGRPVSEIAAKADTVMFCLSKGLGAPVGSMLAGTAETIADARLYRKRLGGGMRQAGVLAAAGLIALDEMPARLSEDHANARFLADAVSRIPGIQVVHEVQTNIVIFDVAATGVSGADLSARLKSRGVLMNPVRGTLMRLVTHLDVTRADCESAAEILAQSVR